MRRGFVRVLACTIACLVSIGCGTYEESPLPGAYTASGIRVVHVEGALRYDVEDIDKVVRAFEAYFGPLDDLGALTIDVYPGRCIIYDAPGCLRGQYSPGLDRIGIAARDECVARTSLAHELLHRWERHTLGYTDGTHSSRTWVEDLPAVNKIAAAEVCGE